ncbi:MAG TPA: hypothetical protein PLZ32_22515, partial [Saprospiraceae bacterium]|nr:hypothetical protein [Saprospiraceae bacterium]
MERRQFTKTTALATSLALLSNNTFGKSFMTIPERKFKLALNPGIIGVKANLQEAIDYAIKFGYEAVSPYPNEVMKYSDAQLDHLLGKMKEHNLTWDSTNIPVEYRLSKRKFNDDFKGLRKFVQTMEKQGATRINTWI